MNQTVNNAINERYLQSSLCFSCNPMHAHIDHFRQTQVQLMHV